MIRKVALVLGTLVVLLVLALVVLAITFDADRFKPQIEGYVASHYQRTLEIDGELSLSVFPRIAITVPATRLSAPDSADPAASVRAVQVAVELLPLLRGAVVADKVRIDGLRAAVIRRRDGSLNFDDLLGRGGTGQAHGRDGAPPAGDRAGGMLGPGSVDIGGIEVTDAELTWIDEIGGQHVTVHDLAASLGAIHTQGTTPAKVSFRVENQQPQAEATVSAAGNLVLDLAAGAASAEGVAIKVVAQLAVDAARKLQANLDVSGLAASTSRATASTVAFSAQLDEPGRTVVAKLAGPLAADLGTTTVELPALSGSIEIEDPAMPGGRLSLPVRAQAGADARHEQANVTLQTTLEDSTIDLEARLKGFGAPHVDFDLRANRLDLDRLAPPVATSAAPARPATPDAPGAAAADTPIDLSALTGLELDGRIAIDELLARGMQASAVRATVKAHDGRLDVAPLAARLYEGTLDAKLSAQAAGNRVSMQAGLADIAIGPLLEAAAGNRLLEGHGRLDLQLATAGASTEAMKRALGGKAALRLVDGAIRGIDIGEKIRRAEEFLGKAQPENAQSDATRKTEFSSFSVSFDIADGIASSTDLDLKSPLLRIEGAGRIDIPAGTIDYLARPALVATAQGQGGRDRDALHGVTVPVHVTGALAAPEWQVDWASVARELLRSKAGDRLRESVAPQVDELKERRDEARDALKDKAADKLRGLLRK